jgi:acyl-CoA thioester hydrolase
VEELDNMARVKLDLPDRYLFSTELMLRVSDINYGGHLGNDAVLSLAQETRVQFLRANGWSEFDVAGAGIMMTDAVVVYRSEGFCGDVVTIDVAVDDIQPLGCDFLFRIANKTTGKEVARVKTGIAFIDRAKRRPMAVPEAFRAVCDKSL